MRLFSNISIVWVLSYRYPARSSYHPVSTPGRWVSRLHARVIPKSVFSGRRRATKRRHVTACTRNELARPCQYLRAPCNDLRHRMAKYDYHCITVAKASASYTTGKCRLVLKSLIRSYTLLRLTGKADRSLRGGNPLN